MGNFCLKFGILFLGVGFLAQHPAFAEEQTVVGALPYSNQWKPERADSYLFLVYEPQTFSSLESVHGGTTVSLQSSKASFYGLNYYTRLGALVGSDRSETTQKELNLWLRFSLGMSNPSTSAGQIYMGRGGVGPMLTWDLNSYVKPYLGAELWGYAYRHSANQNSADFTGQGFMVEPLVGVETLIVAPVHAMAQVGFNRTLTHAPDSLLDDSASFSFGVGASF